MPFADIGPARLFYTDDGHGEPPMLFIHGYTCDSHDWSWQLPHFTERRRVIALDLRGHGRSGAPPDGYRPFDLAGDVAELLRHLSVDRVVAVGHSLGGVVVSVLAVEHPDLVSALVCVDPAYLHPDETKAYTRAACDSLEKGDPVPIVQQILSSWDAPGQDLRCIPGTYAEPPRCPTTSCGGRSAGR